MHCCREGEARGKPRGCIEGIGSGKGPETSEAGSIVEKRGWWQRGVGGEAFKARAFEV